MLSKTLILSLPIVLMGSLVWADAPEDSKAERSEKASTPSPEQLDEMILNEVSNNNEIMSNLEYLSDVIGPRLTASKNLDNASQWSKKKMEDYGLENVHLEPWEVPIGWTRGHATMKLLNPDNGKQFSVVSWGWSPGSGGVKTCKVVSIDALTRDDLKKYKGKLKGAVVLIAPPNQLAPITDLSYFGMRPNAPLNPPIDPDKKLETAPVPKKEEPKKNKIDGPVSFQVLDGHQLIGHEQIRPGKPRTAQRLRAEAAKRNNPPTKTAEEEPKPTDPPKKEEVKPSKKPEEPKRPSAFGSFQMRSIITNFIEDEGAAAYVMQSSKPHGLIAVSGGWRGVDRSTANKGMCKLAASNEDYGILWRLGKRADIDVQVELDVENTFTKEPVVVYNTVGEIRGSGKPGEFVTLGAHLDSWDLGSGTTDNGTGSCVILECARTLGQLAKQGIRPTRTIRFVLYTGEEQGLYGSNEYVKKHKDEMAKTSISLVHDTGTGRVKGFALMGRAAVQKVLEPELEALKSINFEGLSLQNSGGSDHISFESAGVPGFACVQEPEEYRLTHHTQTDTFDKVVEANLVQGAQVLALTAMRVANLPELLPRDKAKRE